jgi:hypothetical protein
MAALATSGFLYAQFGDLLAFLQVQRAWGHLPLATHIYRFLTLVGVFGGGYSKFLLSLLPSVNTQPLHVFEVILQDTFNTLTFVIVASALGYAWRRLPRIHGIVCRTRSCKLSLARGFHSRTHFYNTSRVHRHSGVPRHRLPGPTISAHRPWHSNTLRHDPCHSGCPIRGRILGGMKTPPCPCDARATDRLSCGYGPVAGGVENAYCAARRTDEMAAIMGFTV